MYRMLDVMVGVLSLGTVGYLIYLLVLFGVLVICFASAYQALRIKHGDTRLGFSGMVLCTALWAATLLVYLLAEGTRTRYAAYTIAVFFGLVALIAWLYLCSAYAKMQVHRRPGVRWVLIGVTGVLGLGLATNFYHQRFFTTQQASEPFHHLAVDAELFGLVLLSGTYLFALLGILTLALTFYRAGYRTMPLMGVLGIAMAPVLIDIASIYSNMIISLGYAPLGVPILAIGFLYRGLERFQIVQTTGYLRHPILFIESTGRISDANTPAQEIFPIITESEQVMIDDLDPGLREIVEADEPGTISVERKGVTRTYQVTINPFSIDSTQLSRMISMRERAREH